ncbi:MAG: HAD-IA family hydrolase [Cyanobium sp.]
MAEPLKAVFWDVDGTLAETEMAGHRLAFNHAFAEAGLPWQWDPPTYLRLLRVTGGRERLAVFLAEVEGGVPESSRLDQLQDRKQMHYRELVRGGALVLRAGVARLMAEIAEAGISQAIVTTSGRSAVAALIQASEVDLQRHLSFWVCGEDVARKKPDPEAYRLAVARAGVEPEQVLVVEDSAQGLRAAAAAGLGTLVTLSQVSASEPAAAFAAALAVLDGLGEESRPACVRRGPACQGGQVTLSYLQRLLMEPATMATTTAAPANPDG